MRHARFMVVFFGNHSPTLPRLPAHIARVRFEASVRPLARPSLCFRAKNISRIQAVSRGRPFPLKWLIYPIGETPMPKVFCPVNTNWHQSCCLFGLGERFKRLGEILKTYIIRHFPRLNVDGHHSDTKQ